LFPTHHARRQDDEEPEREDAEGDLCREATSTFTEANPADREAESDADADGTTDCHVIGRMVDAGCEEAQD
jgi:hypothetical protein